MAVTVVPEPEAAGPGGALRKALRPAAWTRDAHCLGRATAAADPWSPDEDLPRAVRDQLVAQARTVCATCPVRYPCAVEALEAADAHGVRGGLTPADRRLVAARFRYPTPGAAQCGTRSQYVTGCRCDDCKRSRAARREEVATRSSPLTAAAAAA